MKKLLALLVTATLLAVGGLTIASAAESPGSTPSTSGGLGRGMLFEKIEGPSQEGQ